jgi:hypothetical protein
MTVLISMKVITNVFNFLSFEIQAAAYKMLATFILANQNKSSHFCLLHMSRPAREQDWCTVPQPMAMKTTWWLSNIPFVL